MANLDTSSERPSRSVGSRSTQTPTSRTRQAQRGLQSRIKEWILDNGLETGDPMPTEAELVEELGVSRNSVREALKALQAVRIVEIRHGFGTYVGDCSLDPFAEALVFRARKSLRGSRHDLYELVDLRQGLEAGLIGQIIATIDAAGLQRLSAALDRLQQHAGQGEQSDRADRAFHEELFSSLDNQLMSQLLRVFWDAYHAISSDLPPVQRDASDIVAVHRGIYEAVEARDTARAIAAIHHHFKGIRARIRQDD